MMMQHEFDEIRRTASQNKIPDETEAAREDQAEEIRVEDAERTKHLETGIDKILDLFRPEDSKNPHIQEKLRKLCAMLPSTGEGQQILTFPTESPNKTTDDALRHREIEDRTRAADKNKQPSEKRKYQSALEKIENELPSRKKKRQGRNSTRNGDRKWRWDHMDRELGPSDYEPSRFPTMGEPMDDAALDENWSVAATTGRRTPKLPRPETPELRSNASRDMNVSSAQTFGRADVKERRKQAEEWRKRSP
ncbi:hypothetical protein CB0940_11443 [Cercospora beticola]|uniref:Uncharacterized protein n=1 Tax=Cercospora beticola TaxID=122368 RepID=A0A2G5HDM1_CERBT|nr:hypothetical protein CB0940_11443 [Cercospora beticola]PIA90363.1 hypothetical protein CB0940_11443 [Cercospora beticola]WPB08296.1 hypothetical protein RHO25_012962 [Cercospora beticola]CAK1367822.1 unnamed protein product [Cercospora beticola]